MKAPLLLVLPLVVAGCSRMTDEQLWSKVEAAKAHHNWDSTRQVCETILTEYPTGRYAPWARFGLAESYRFQHQPAKAVDNYKMFYREYPSMEPSALSLFLIGYLYNNELSDPDSARPYYRTFLERFPHHELAPSVRLELQTLGMDPAVVLEQQQQHSLKN